MARGLDYSFSHPNLTCVRNSGYEFVARYIGDPDPNSAKYLDAGELGGILAAGLKVVVVRETTAGFMFTDSGRTHAKASRDHCNNLGMRGIPIYYALDVDPRGLNSSQRAAVARFLADAAAQDGGGHNVGIYGSDDALDWFMGPNCHWGWQTYAWSSGRVTPRAHFRQYLNGQRICGGTVDLNETYATDYGQWPRPATTPSVTPPTQQKDEDMPYLLASRFTGVSLHDGAGGTWISDPATVTELVNQGVPVVRMDANESDARRYVGEHSAGTDEKILDQTNAEIMYTAAIAQIEGREEARDLAALPASESASEDAPE
jgi:hypothetical protein